MLWHDSDDPQGCCGLARRFLRGANVKSRYWRRSHCTANGWGEALVKGTGSGHIKSDFVFNIYRTHAAMCTVTDQSNH